MNCLEKAKHQNLLVVLPPQMGKTYVACQLAEWYRGQDQLVAYTVPSVELCNQAARCLARQLPQAAVATVTGECRWEKEEWNKGCNGNDVIIATPECFRQALQSSWLNPGDIALFIFDECHHATGKSPMGIILKEHLHPSSHPPRLLALTSCPFPSRKRGRPGGNGAGHAAHAALVELEEIFRAELCWPQVANDAEEMIESPLQSKSWEKAQQTPSSSGATGSPHPESLGQFHWDVTMMQALSLNFSEVIGKVSAMCWALERRPETSEPWWTECRRSSSSLAETGCSTTSTTAAPHKSEKP